MKSWWYILISNTNLLIDMHRFSKIRQEFGSYHTNKYWESINVTNSRWLPTLHGLQVFKRNTWTNTGMKLNRKACLTILTKLKLSWRCKFLINTLLSWIMCQCYALTKITSKYLILTLVKWSSWFPNEDTRLLRRKLVWW